MTMLLLSAAWLAGLVMSAQISLETHQWLILTGLAILAYFLTTEYRLSRYLFGILLTLCLAAARNQQYQQVHSPTGLTKYNDLPRQVQIEGVITGYPEEREHQIQFAVKADSIQVGAGPETNIDGKLLARANRFTNWTFGDQVRLIGRLETPPEFEGFSYKAYLARQGIFTILEVDHGEIIRTNQANPILYAIFQLRSRAHSVVVRIFPEPEASLLSGILLGLEAGISPEMRQAFDRTGTTHIIAISGFNITIIASLFIRAGKRWLGVRRGTVFAAVAILTYTILVGADAAVTRAALMAFLALLAQHLGRRTDGMAALGAAAILMSALDPTIIADVGFQLSFAATLGLILYTDSITDFILTRLATHFGSNFMSGDHISGPISEYISASWAAQVTTLPLILLHFQRLSIVAPLANLLILPAQPAVMILSGTATVAGLLWLPLGRALAWIAWPFAKITISVVDGLAQLPLASVSTPPIQFPLVLLLYAILLLFTSRDRLSAYQPVTSGLEHFPWPLSLLIVLIANMLVWRLALAKPDGRLHLTLLATGNQPSILIVTSQGRKVLINGGASSIQLGAQLDSHISPLQRQLDWIILTDTTEEVAAGISGLIERYSVGGALVVAPSNSPAYRAITENLTELNRPIGPFLDNQPMDLGAGARLRLKSLEDGSILVLENGRSRFLLVTGRPRGWHRQQAATDWSAVTAVLLPGSGDASLSPPSQVESLQPNLVLLAVDPAETRGFPSRALTERLSDYTILRTDHHGWINLSSDGRYLWVETERLPGQNSPVEIKSIQLFPIGFPRLSLD